MNVVGKNGYLIIDIIAYKRDISPFGLEIINGKLNYFNNFKTNKLIISFKTLEFQEK